ncbi:MULTISPECIES: CBS domain-containing protein [unclassified Moritella]|uniref:CBS domain-containing protein n=1 Tax=unclassified Moritella TaxID=2637987 RepID=UPI001BAC41EC|nr:MULTISPECIES: CBS domain-containing protein [unclassified Moritella]QUM86710.1 CBS domain-containing protein [Moritella sp. 28]QUM90937.1 CBS domain-containing protein [Moritella sp. 36]
MTMQRVMNEMKIKAPSIPCGTSLVAVVDLFAKHQISAVPVVNSTNEVIGLVSESDCLQALISGSYHCDKPAIVNDVMTKSVVRVSPKDSIIDIAISMTKDNLSVYPVVEDRQLVGIIRRGDILQVLAENNNQCSQIS